MGSLKRREALTLVELLTAMTLAAVLLISVIGVVGRLTLTRGYLLEHHSPSTWKTQTAEMIREDMANARHIEVSERELRIMGFGGRDFRTGAKIHDRAIISYRVVTLAGRSWLLRRVQRLDAQLGRDVRTELICPDVTQIDLRVYVARRDEWTSEVWRAGRRKRLAVPPICRVVLLGSSGSNRLGSVLDVFVVSDCGVREG